MDHEERLKAALADRYAIEREIGSGGMATVYLAQDLKHNRQVALKVLKPELAAVLGGERFLSEIQTTANLQHPNILPLFDSGEANGFLYYVMPYVEGESLRDRLDRERQLPVDDAVRIASEVAEALQAAHDDGIIHRDIKPANILLRKGKPLVADFGIALAVSAAGGGRLTETGLSLGTPYYMSPEQASADQDPDARSDIYSLGCVLYEALTGEPPFPGNTAQAVLAKILMGETVSPSEHRRAIPPNVEAAVLKSIERLPADRFSSVRDFARALADPGFRHGGRSVVVGVASQRPWKAASIGLGTLGVFLAATLAWLLLQPEPPREVGWFPLDAADVPMAFQTAITPDGKGMVYSAPGDDGTPQLWFHRWSASSPSPIAGTQGALQWTLAPEGEEVAYLANSGSLVVTSLLGGVPHTVTDSATNTPHWGDDGFIYFTDTSRGISRVPAQGGEIEVVADVGPTASGLFFPHVRAKWDLALVSVWDTIRRVDAVRLSTGERTQVTLGDRGYLLDSGHLVFVTPNGSLMAAPFDRDGLELRSSPVLVTEGVYMTANNTPYFSVSGNGHLLFWSGRSTETSLEFVWVDREGDAEPVQQGWTFDPGADNMGWDLSPEERRIALKAVTDLGADVWVKELPEGPLRRLTFHEAEDRMPRWAPDGEHITFLSSRGGNYDVWTRRADGVGEASLLVDQESPIYDMTWSPDGEWLILRAGGLAGIAGGRDLLALRPGLDSVLVPMVATPADETGPALSPDGRLLAYVSTETGSRQVFLSPFPETQQWKVQVSTSGGRGPKWGRGGRELFFLADGGGTTSSREFWVAYIDEGLPPAVTGREVLFTLPEGYYFANNSTSYDVTADGQRFLMAREHRTQEAPENQLIFVQNWAELVKERAER